MKVQRLIEEIKKHAIYHCGEKECYKEGCTQVVDLGVVLGLVKQLDEPKPVKVPPLVSVWYRINKDNLDKNIAYLCSNWEKSKNDDALFKWMSNTDNFIQILVNMHQFGYEVEKGKQYLVKIKATKHYLVKDGNGKIFFSLAFKGYFTKKELEEVGFGWVFDCPGIEIEEAER